MIYKIASIIKMIDKISKNEIKMIVWALISFLMMIDECRDFSTEIMMNYCMNFLIDESRNFLMNETDYCKIFLIFLKFLELLIEMKMRVIASENSSLLMTREVILWVIVAKEIFLE
jgi:hypothetical protein